jgi:hypothetical protein
MDNAKLYVINFRCPICGHIVNVSNLYKSFPIEIFIRHGLGYGRGFKLETIKNKQIVDLVKQKIRALYSQFFGHEIPVKKFEDVPVQYYSTIFENKEMNYINSIGMDVISLEGWDNVKF